MMITAILIGLGIILLFAVGFIAFIASTYKKIPQGQALVRTGKGGTKVAFDGMTILPVLHRYEIMDIALKKIEISRLGKDGLICQDNMRADIKVAFFVRVNPDVEDVSRVAQTIGTERASDINTLNDLFEAKFSEALKTVGKRFEFVDLYDSREDFKRQLLDIIGTDLNGYILDDAAIDYLEQTPLEFLKDDNILDAEGIKKITELTAEQNMKSNLIRREEEKAIKKQNVEAQEAILELERQLAEKEERQRREIANITSREEAQIQKVAEEERLMVERIRISTDEELEVATQNKERQVIVALKQKERTEAVESERVEKDRMLEQTEREKIIALAEIEKEKSIEEERRIIQDVIKERVIVERTVVEEQEKMKDLEAIKEAERKKQVAIVGAEQAAEAILIESIKTAEAEQKSAEFKAKQRLIEAEAQEQASVKEAEAMKILAEAEAATKAAEGMAEAQIIEAKAAAMEKQGEAEAQVIEAKAIAEAKGIEVTSEAQAEADRKIGIAEAKVIEIRSEAEKVKGLADAEVIEAKGIADAKGIEEKAKAMSQLDGAGKEHEEFKLKLAKEKEIELAEINIQEAISQAQAKVLSEALKSANIDIVGGDNAFFDQMMEAVTRGKKVDKMVNNSTVLTELKNSLMGSGGPVTQNLKTLVQQAGIGSDDIRNLTLTALLLQLQQKLNGQDKGMIASIMDTVQQLGLGTESAVKYLN